MYSEQNNNIFLTSIEMVIRVEAYFIPRERLLTHALSWDYLRYLRREVVEMFYCIFAQIQSKIKSYSWLQTYAY